MKVAVGSLNPVKIKAAELAFKEVWPEKDWDVLSTEAVSGVSNQPMSDKEAVLGARNRAKQAIEKTQADYGVGIEGGIQEIDGSYFDCGWIVILDKENNEGIGSTIKMIVPEKMIGMIKKGIELGSVNDIIFNKSNSKQNEGHFGSMTNNIITRTKGYKDGVIAALSRFIRPDLFEASNCER
ncbi:MAG: inosine/xanthosine triphosphatase [Candidatus Pacebacteria bacterium]|nr:inosine/xanthosine triphosphatase [Candidatus Paceibacterota bacterium]